MPAFPHRTPQPLPTEVLEIPVSTTCDELTSEQMVTLLGMLPDINSDIFNFVEAIVWMKVAQARGAKQKHFFRYMEKFMQTYGVGLAEDVWERLQIRRRQEDSIFVSEPPEPKPLGELFEELYGHSAEDDQHPPIDLVPKVKGEPNGDDAQHSTQSDTDIEFSSENLVAWFRDRVRQLEDHNNDLREVNRTLRARLMEFEVTAKAR